jgi:7,8-dihydro-6-hydroxymethylpterin-pyrophosphokinase
VNGACGFLTSLSPRALLDQLQVLELAMGKVKQRHWGERLIDLDIICYAQTVLKTERLSLPHPMAAQRDFVLVPLLDLAPGLVLPGYGSIECCLANLPDSFLYASDVSNHKVIA